MPIELVDESAFQFRSLSASNGLSIRVLPSGCLYSIECEGTLINQILASPLAGGIHRIFLRVYGDEGIEFTEIVGPNAASKLASADDRLAWSGSSHGLHYRCTCWLHPSGGGWFFHVELENPTARPARCDVVLVQDVGLASREQVRNNEIFTSQYLDHTALRHSEVGYLLMSRQNLPQTNETHPWLLQGCFPEVVGFTSDGFDFFGIDYKNDSLPRALTQPVIGDRIRQYEAAYTAIQSNQAQLAPAGSQAWTFFAHFLANHPEPSSQADVQRLTAVQTMRDDMVSALTTQCEMVETAACRNVFQTSELLGAEEFDHSDIEAHFPGPRRHEEMDAGRLLSFFHGDDARHVVLKAKELCSARPHGHIMRAGQGITPDAQLMSCACFAAGVFASQLALGNTSLGKLLSSARDPLNLVRSSGLRIFMRKDSSSAWRLLGVPSAFEMALNGCRWYYKHGRNLLTVSCTAAENDPAFTFDIHAQEQVDLLISGEIAAGPVEYESSPQMSIDAGKHRISIRPDARSLLGMKQPGFVYHIVTSTADALEAIGGDELLFADGESRRNPYLAIRTRATSSFTFTILGALDDSSRMEALCAKCETPGSSSSPASVAEDGFWRRMTGGIRVTLPAREKSTQIQDSLAWFARDAVVHLSTPRGLEQHNGGAWGVRDVCQGSIEFLLSYDHREIAADILRKVFSQQYERRGDWPQWFMFPPFQEIQSKHCHGDNLIWPLKALCDYLEHSNDASILDERLPWTDDESLQRTERVGTILEHCDRLRVKMREEFLPGIALPRFGEGDWDDSLQPADPMLRERMVSSWTAELMYQTLRRYGAALSHFGQTKRALEVESLASAIEADFHRYMMPDAVVAGFAVFDGEPARPVEYLLHPSDSRTGLRYRLIPMTRGILSGIFSLKQAKSHLDLIREHLLFPDGARLMDRPTSYSGGIEHTFRRSESAAFFGREIGLMYVHAHLRYAEALAKMGYAEELWHALQVVNPIAVTEVVRNARRRQRNCYFSSSDAAFADRYEASRDYGKLRHGELPVDGGWRIYSSGPGIYTSLVIRHLFGIRRYFDYVEFDPVLSREMDGSTCELLQDGRRIRFQFSVRNDVCSPSRVTVNGVELTISARSANPFRRGGARISQTQFQSALTSYENLVTIEL